jgi:hypothetical protein
MTRLSFNGKRVVLGIGLLLCLLCVANDYLDLGVFGRFGRQATIVSFVVLAVVQHFLGPTLSEVREYRDKKRGAAPPRS